MKQTAVEWLVEQLEKHHVKIDIKNTVVFEQAKAMEKEQIIKAVYDAMGTNFDPNIGRAEQYYNETYTQSHIFQRNGTSHECKICGQHEYNHYTK